MHGDLLSVRQRLSEMQTDGQARNFVKGALTGVAVCSVVEFLHAAAT